MIKIKKDHESTKRRKHERGETIVDLDFKEVNIEFAEMEKQRQEGLSTNFRVFVLSRFRDYLN